MKKKRLIAAFGDKGGVGKSTVSRVLAETLISAGKSPLLVDADQTVGHLVTYLGVRGDDGLPIIPQPSEGVRVYSLHGNERDRIEFGGILDEGRDLIVVDFPAASATVLQQVEEDYGFFALAHEAGYEVTLVVVGTPDAASLLAVSDAAVLDPHADLVFVRNLAFGDKADFIVWDGSDHDNVPSAKGKDILKSRGGFDLTLPRLNAGTVALIGAHRLTFSAAASKASPLTSPRRSQVERWLNSTRAEFAKAAKVLGL